MNQTSWPFSLSLAACLVGMVFASITQPTPEDHSSTRWPIWPVALILCALGLWSILAGNINTLLLGWAALDLVWLTMMLVTGKSGFAALFPLAIRMAGLFLVVGASFTRPPGVTINLPPINLQTNTLLFGGALLRLGSITPVVFTNRTASQRKFIYYFSDLVIAATALAIIGQCARVGLLPGFTKLAGTVGLVFAMLNSFLWLIFARQLDAHRYWLLGCSGLAVVACANQFEEASQAIGVAGTLLGSLIVFSHRQQRLLRPIFVIGGLGILSLPFTPAWQADWLYPELSLAFSTSLAWIIILAAHIFLVTGFLLIALYPWPPLTGVPPWLVLVYSTGLVILPLSHWLILIFGSPGISNDLQAFPSLESGWAGIAVSILSIGLTWIILRTPTQFDRVGNNLVRIPVLALAARLVEPGYQLTGRLIGFFEAIMEGEAGTLWTLLFIILLFALLFQFGRSG
ncbi:MAG: hypothetical protein MUE67_00640 [Anaerolineales bacterium]|nr:hypothetical protein [Anaerolineales bacterium]